VFAGRQLADDCSLAHCGVGEEATLNVLGRLLGGAKKRKKKTYTKPKKIKHKHKKIKLRVLQFYKVRDARQCVWAVAAKCPTAVVMPSEVCRASGDAMQSQCQLYASDSSVKLCVATASGGFLG